MSRGSSPVAGQHGFTLIEVVHTLALLGVGLLGLSSLTIGTIHGNSTAKRITSAAVLAQDKIEEMRRADYPAIVSGSDQTLVTGVPYDRSWTVCSDCPLAGAKQVTVEVSWQDEAHESVEMQTIITR